MKGRGLLWFAIALFGVFFIVASTIPPKVLLEASRTIYITVVIAVLISFSGVALKAVRRRDMSSADVLGLGIFISFLGHLGLGIWMLLWRLSGQSAWMVNSDLTAFWIALQTVGAMFYLAAPGAINGHVPPKNRVIIGIASAIGLGTFVAMIALGVDFSGFSESLKPWLWDGNDYRYGVPYPEWRALP